jgi:hypothetical protein
MLWLVKRVPKISKFTEKYFTYFYVLGLEVVHVGGG